ncbi:MAG TPA: glycosyltransferase [Patescibacteria group bacterium]|nr:glycosyltransferase [Patescibacteria group bacterium]
MKNSKGILKDRKIAIIVEELTQLGGAERLLDCFLELFPKAPVFTIVWDKVKTLHRYDKFDVRPSFIQELPFGVNRYKWYLTLMPKAVESLDLKDFDIVLSITSALVKGVKTNSNQLHICYCNTPTRWLWTDSQNYLKTAPIPFFARPLMPTIINALKKWDIKASKRPNYFIANSENVRKRIKKYYHRDSFPIFVPVEAKKFKPTIKKGEYYLMVSRLEPYKKVEMVIEAFKRLDLPLKIVGFGTKFEELKKSVPKNIKLIGRVSDEKLAKIYQRSIATIFPQEEDAGIVPLESMAAGRPVIAFAKGGALETVVEGKTGVLFKVQTVGGLIKAIKKFQNRKFNAKIIRLHAQKFDKELFKKKILMYIEDKLKIQTSKIFNL